MLNQKKVVTRKKGEKGFTEVNRKKSIKGKIAKPINQKRKYHKKTEAEKAAIAAEKIAIQKRREERLKKKADVEPDAEAKKKSKKIKIVPDKKSDKKEKTKVTKLKKAVKAKKDTTSPEKPPLPPDKWIEEGHDLSRWGLEIWGVLHSFAGNNAADINKIISGKGDVPKAILKASLIRLEKITVNPDSLPEEIELAIEEVRQEQETNLDYEAPLVVIRKDEQDLGSDNLPLPMICAHYVKAAFRDEGSNGYADKFRLATTVKQTGRIGKEHVRKVLDVYPYHIGLYSDPKMTSRILASQITINGQQPVKNGVPGFSRYEGLVGPMYFKFNIIFKPMSQFPCFCWDNREVVKECLVGSAFRGFGGKRSANFGQWQVIQGRYIRFKESIKMVD